MKKKIVALALVFCLALAIGVGGTLAYLTAITGPVTNTFTVGNVKFDGQGLDEADVDVYGVKKTVSDGEDGTKDAPRVTKNKYKLIPGHTYVKDPTIHIAANNEDCWVFVKVVNPISSIEKGDVKGEPATTIKGQMTSGESAKWAVVDETNGIYAYKTKVTSKTTVQDIVVFESFTLADNADVGATETVNGEATLKYENAEITIQAGLIQADGFDTYTAAWNANSMLFDSTAETETDPVDLAE